MSRMVPDDVVVLQILKDGDLSRRGRAHSFLIGPEWDQLDCHDGIGIRQFTPIHASVRSLS